MSKRIVTFDCFNAEAGSNKHPYENQVSQLTTPRVLFA